MTPIAKICDLEFYMSMLIHLKEKSLHWKYQCLIGAGGGDGGGGVVIG